MCRIDSLMPSLYCVALMFFFNWDKICERTLFHKPVWKLWDTTDNSNLIMKYCTCFREHKSPVPKEWSYRFSAAEILICDSSVDKRLMVVLWHCFDLNLLLSDSKGGCGTIELAWFSSFYPRSALLLLLPALVQPGLHPPLIR